MELLLIPREMVNVRLKFRLQSCFVKLILLNISINPKNISPEWTAILLLLIG